MTRIPMLLRALTLVVLPLALASCGFHLRDALLLPGDLGPLRVVSQDPYSPLGQSLSEALGRAGATPAADGVVDDVATLQILSERWESTPLSVDQFGRAQEYTLRYAVVFRLRRADASDLVPQQVIELSRDYISIPTNSSGTESEREILSRELRRDMVASILRRIDAASRMPAAVAVPGVDPSQATPDAPSEAGDAPPATVPTP
jgi:LPS-assembly lipoprotein